MRKKWDSPRGGVTYGARTIAFAFNGKSGGYDPGRPSIARKVYKQTDLGNAERLIDAYGDRIRYCHKWNKWLIYDGKRWALDETGEIVRLAKQTIRNAWPELREIEDHDERKRMSQFLHKSEHLQRINAMITLAQSEVPVTPEELDADPWLLNCPNGTVDLRTGELRPHRMDDLITKLCPTEFIPEAQCLAWDRFLGSVFGDSELIGFVQRLIGYALTGDVREQILPILHGDGANGKSTLLNAVMGAIGPDYSMQAIPDMLMERRGEAHPTERADLFGRRFVSAVETDSDRSLAESTIKVLTGGERIRARRMREDFWEFDPTHKIFLCTNHRPRVNGTDHALWRRIVLVPFNVRFWNPGKGETGPDELRQDKALPERLRAEAEGILAWAVRGCLEWQHRGLDIPKAARLETEKYRSEEDLVSRFVEEACATEPGLTVKSSELFERFRDWCKAEGEAAPSHRKFGRALSGRKGIERYKNNGTFYRGIA